MKKYKNPYLRNLDTILSHEDDPKNPYLSHGWGKKPEQKAKEKEYNHKYYEAHKEKWGVGDHLKALGSSVKESLQKHNENWQSGMDTILKKNVTSQSSPSATVQKKKVNSASAMAANEKAKAEVAAKQYRQATAAQRRASAMAGSEQARANEAAKNYRKANASAERAKAEAASKKAAQDLQQFKSEQRKNAEKIAEMHKEFEDQKKAKIVEQQTSAQAQDQGRRELEAHSKHYAIQKQNQESYKQASQYIPTLNKSMATLDKKANEYDNAYREAFRQYDRMAALAKQAAENYNAVKNGLGVYEVRDSKGNIMSLEQLENNVKLTEQAAEEYRQNGIKYQQAASECRKKKNELAKEKEFFEDYMKNTGNYKVSGKTYTKKMSK